MTVDRGLNVIDIVGVVADYIRGLAGITAVDANAPRVVVVDERDEGVAGIWSVQSFPKVDGFV